jgi:diaminopimelate decarboxylase
MHFASDVCGARRWLDLFSQYLNWAICLRDASGCAFSLVDVGGGWHSADFRDVLLPLLPKLQRDILKVLPSVNAIRVEPISAFHGLLMVQAFR